MASNTLTSQEITKAYDDYRGDNIDVSYFDFEAGMKAQQSVIDAYLAENNRLKEENERKAKVIEKLEREIHYMNREELEG